ncbi:MAG TPA: hypothetical protein VFX30_02625 [bacterium]|nr:hypothetical protein [bacterium]
MSLTITIKDKTFELPAEGDNGNQEIDTKEEAEAALSHLPEGSTDSVTVGERSYTRAQLTDIRDGKGADAAEKKEGSSGMPGGVSHGISLEGGAQGGLGDNGHLMGNANLTYRLGIPLLTGNIGALLTPFLGLGIGHASSDYQTPGGEDANSAYTNIGAMFGLDFTMYPAFDKAPVFFGVGARTNIGGLMTEESTTVSTPANCEPGDFGRSECEPSAGPRTGNAGTTGLKNPDAGSSRGTNGAAIDLTFPITLGADVLRGDFGNLQLFGSFVPGISFVLPSDGHGFSYPTVGGAGGVRVNFGGNASKPSVVDEDHDGIEDSKDECKGTKPGIEVDDKGCEKTPEGPVEIKGATIDATVSAADDAQQFTVKFNPPVTGEVKSASIVDSKGKTVTEAEVDPTKLNQTGEVTVKPKSKLAEGDYTVVINMEVDGKPAVAKAPLKVAGNFNVTDFGTSLKGTVAPGASFSVEQNMSAEGTLTVVYQKKTDTGKRGAIAGKDDAIGKMGVGQSKRENLAVKDLTPGEYFVDFVYESGGTKVIKTVSITVAEKPKTAEVSGVTVLTGTSPYVGDPLSVKVTLKNKAAADTKVKVNVGGANAEGTIKKDSDTVDVQVWGRNEAIPRAGQGTHTIKVTPEGGTEFAGPQVRVGWGGGSGQTTNTNKGKLPGAGNR